MNISTMNSLTPQPGQMRQINVYPNLFRSRISLEITTEEKESAIVCMLDQAGRIVRMFSWPLKPGTNKTTLEGLESLPSGNYSIQIKQPSGKLLDKLSLSKQ